MKKLITLSLCLTVLMTNMAFSMDKEDADDSKKSVSKIKTPSNNHKKNSPNSYGVWNMLEDIAGLVSILGIFYEFAIEPALQSGQLHGIETSLPEIGFFDPLDMMQ